MNAVIPVSEETGFDVVIVGAGIGAHSVALSLPSTLRIAMISQDAVQTSSHWAKGGIAAESCLSEIDAHLEDTLAAGARLNDRDQVHRLVSGAPEAIRFLVELGVVFEPTLEREGGHQSARIWHADGDATGLAVMRVLGARRAASLNITSTTARLVQLVTDGDCVQGALVEQQGSLVLLKARSVVLATGGATGLWSDHTSPDGNIGTGMVAAYRVGATLGDLEFTQFHPTAIALTGSPLPLATEALRGAGAWIVDAEGKRFLFASDPAGELATRDKVSLAMHRHQGMSFLDVEPIGPAALAKRFPSFLEACRRYGHDPFANGPVPIRPAAHYSIGGIVAGPHGETNIQGLYAVGECANSGVHGANRLASNALLEGLVFGRRAAAHIKDRPTLRQRLRYPSTLALSPRAPSRAAISAIVDVGLGVERDHPTLQRSQAALEALVSNEMNPYLASELQSARELVAMTIQAATLRRGTIGSHTRSDAITENPNYRIEFNQSQPPRRVERQS